MRCLKKYAQNLTGNYLYRVSQREGNSKRQTFGYSHNENGDTNNDELDVKTL